MPSLRSTLLAASVLLSTACARDVPANVQDFHDSLVKQGQCKKALAKGFWNSDGDGAKASYCGDRLKDYNVIYLQSSKGELSNLDVDCDGAQGSQHYDTRCGSSTDTQSQTSFMDTLETYGTTQKDLDSSVHPYVVFGNVGTKKGYTNFNPRDHGVEPLSIIAVVCGEKLIYGIWGDENGDDDEHPMVGEGSLALATACFGESMTGNNGHDANDVLYIAFPGKDAVPGAEAAWNASNYDDFASSISGLGDKLIERIDSSKKDDSGAPSRSIISGSMFAAVLAALFLF